MQDIVTTVVFSSSEIPDGGVEFKKIIVGEAEQSIIAQCLCSYEGTGVIPINRYELSSVITSLLIRTLQAQDEVRKEELIEMCKQWQDVSDTINTCMNEVDTFYMHIDYEVVE